MSDKTEILLFVSKESIYFQSTLEEFRELLSKLEDAQPYEQQVIDINDNPEMAEKYKIDALPTLVINDKKFVGRPNADKIITTLQGTE